MILIVDMNWKKDSLGLDEFVLPIVSIVEEYEDFRITHFLDIKQEERKNYSKVVLSGTALKDHATLSQLELFEWIKTFDKPVLGICAGMQTIGMVFGAKLARCLQIGMTEISTLNINPLFQGTFKAYTLHNYSIQPTQDFQLLAESSKCIQAIKHKQKNIYGVLFHPEVRNQNILQNFIQL